MKKIMCFIMVFILCFAAVAYASEATPTDVKYSKKSTKKATPTDISKDIDAASIFGKEVNGNYENEFLGLGFKLGDWALASEEELNALNKVTTDVIKSNLDKDIGLDDNVTIMMAAAPDGKSNINIMLRDMKDYMEAIETMGIDMVISSSLDASKEMYSQIGFENVKMDSAKIRVEKKDYSGVNVYYEAQGVPTYLKQIWLLKDNYMAYITITCMEEDKTDEVVQKLYNLK